MASKPTRSQDPDRFRRWAAHNRRLSNKIRDLTIIYFKRNVTIVPFFSNATDDVDDVVPSHDLEKCILVPVPEASPLSICEFVDESSLQRGSYGIQCVTLDKVLIIKQRL